MSDSNTIIDPNPSSEQKKATVRSTLAMAVEMGEPETITMDQVRSFLKGLDKDQDNIERKELGEQGANYYFGRMQLKETEDYMVAEFPDTWKTKVKQAENFTKSVSRQLSQMYKSPPKRDPVTLRGKKPLS